MKIWILKPNETKPLNGETKRLGRMGLLSENLSKKGHDVIWFTSTFSHLEKKQIFEEDKEVTIAPNYKIEFIKTLSYKKIFQL